VKEPVAVPQPVALPPCAPGGPDPAAITDAIGAWLAAPELNELVGRFGGELPAGPTGTVLDWLAGFSSVWDFRGGVRERFDPTHVDYGDAEDRLRVLIGSLGLGGRDRPGGDRYDHVLVLGGGIRVTLGRADYTARLLADGVRTDTVCGLGSLRRRHDREHREAVRLGLEPDEMQTEAGMMLVGLRRYLGLTGTPTTRGGDDWWQRTWVAPRPDVEAVHVLAAASTRPPARANTADTLIGWATQVHAPTATERVLLVTNYPYVHHQHCDAIRLLGLRYGCGIETVGFDEVAMREWGRPFGTSELLQEVRSSVLSMRTLHDALQPTR
jgi:hypothetical protein